MCGTAALFMPLVLLMPGLFPAAGATADETAIRAVDSQMVAALNARDVDRWLGFFTDNATMMPPNEPAVVGKAAIRKLISALLEIPSFAVAHDPGTLEVSRSGDLAYISYAYELTVKDSKGTPVTEKGKDISVYKKVGGSWKLHIDMWSSDTPALAVPK